MDPGMADVKRDHTWSPAPSGAGWYWLPEGELAAALRLPDRATRIVALAKYVIGPGVVQLATGDGRVFRTTMDDYPPSGNGVRPVFADARPTDYGLAVTFGEYGAASDAALDDGEFIGTLFDPTDYDGTAPDPHATADQAALLDRAVALLDRTEGSEALAGADQAEWQSVIEGLRRATPGLYGCEWIHRGWDLMLHGSKLFTNRWTPEMAYRQGEWWEAFVAKRNTAEPKRDPVPVVDASALR